MNPLLYLPPEFAHKLALIGSAFLPKTPDDPKTLGVDVLGLRFANPVGLSAGADKEAAALTGWDRMGFGFVEVGTVTPDIRRGNPSPRIWRFKKENAVVNWLGLPGKGPEVVLENLKRFRRNPATRLKIGVSIAAPDGDLENFKMLSRAFSPLADYLTLNASCPNVAGHVARDAAAEMCAQVSAVVSEAGQCPVLLKLGPARDAELLQIMVQAALDAGARGFVACNTVPFDNRELLGSVNFDWPQRGGQPVGGYSGPGLLPISTRMVREIRRIGGPDIAIMGVGGIQSAKDAQAMLAAGADLIQLYTGFIYQGPRLIRGIKAALV